MLLSENANHSEMVEATVQAAQTHGASGASVGSLYFLLEIFVLFRQRRDETKMIEHVGFTEKYWLPAVAIIGLALPAFYRTAKWQSRGSALVQTRSKRYSYIDSGSGH